MKLVTCKKDPGKGKSGSGYSADGNKLHVFGEQFTPKWAGNDSGSNRSGGWGTGGKKRYTALLQMVRTSRRNPEKIEIERKYLEMLRREKGITAPDAVGHRVTLKKRKQGNEEEAAEYHETFGEEMEGLMARMERRTPQEVEEGGSGHDGTRGGQQGDGRSFMGEDGSIAPV
jgi:hypothetical protein